ncbi:MAG: rhomboid family intramembrane serine protease [Planctomycetes bacterium]|nr:rhomboid family intramembrane serine protease [Planctomycetota bacterium]
MSWDRDYFGPTDRVERRLNASYVLIALAVGWFVLEFLWSGIFFRTSPLVDGIRRWSVLQPVEVVHRFRVWQLLTHLLVHLDPFSLFFNMLLLYFFGKMLEDLIGWRRFLILYLGGGLIAGLAYVAVGYLLFPGIPYWGPYGALMAVLVMGALTWPDLPVWLFFIFRIKLKWLVLLLIAADIWVSVKYLGVGSLAHLVAAAWGFGFCRLHHRVADAFARWDENAERKARVKDERAEHEMEEEVDRILAKIAREGMSALTPSEKRMLEQASRKKRVR